MHSTIRPMVVLLYVVALASHFLTTICQAQAPNPQGQTCRLQDARRPGELCKVKMLVRSESKLRVKDPKGDEQVFPLKASGQLEFAQRHISSNPDGDFVARNYSAAKSDVTGGTETQTIQLAENRRTITVLLDDDGITRKAIEGAISHPELELLNTPGDLLAAYRLLPGRDVRLGERWKPTDTAIRQLLNFQTIGVNDTKIELIKVDRGLATMKLTGTVRGMVDGAVSETRIKGDLRYDLNWNRVNWLHLILDDNREAGPSAPAVRSAVEMRMLVEPTKVAPALDQPAVVQLGQPASGDQPAMLKYESPSGFRLLHEPSWVPIADQQRRAIFRLVEQDEAIGQCHIARLSDDAPGKQTSVEEFQRDVQSALGDRFGKMVAANQAERRDGIRVLRAIAEGVVQEVPIRWIYYHLSDSQGARASIVFTVDAKNLERFGTRDRAIAGSLSFTPVQTPTTEPPTQTAAQPGQPRR